MTLTGCVFSLRVQIPISLPYMEPFRTITNTEGVDLKKLTYREMCKFYAFEPPHSTSNRRHSNNRARAQAQRTA